MAKESKLLRKGAVDSFRQIVGEMDIEAVKILGGDIMGQEVNSEGYGLGVHEEMETDSEDDDEEEDDEEEEEVKMDDENSDEESSDEENNTDKNKDNKHQYISLHHKSQFTICKQTIHSDRRSRLS